MGSLNQFLGITAKVTPTGLLLHQKRYAENILAREGMLNSKTVATPSYIKVIPTTQSALFTNPKLYRQFVGTLQYLTLTRSNISYTVNRACQHMHQPNMSDFEALKRILRYI